jgi:CDP-glucose 4,6-dehydratase
MDLSFWSGKKVFVTGMTGFKGTWLAHALLSAGAEVQGLGLAPSTSPSVFAATGLAARAKVDLTDICDKSKLGNILSAFAPDVIFHLAAQPIVSTSYADPAETYRTNVMGTVTLLDLLRPVKSKTVCVVVTTDKVYSNKNWVWGYREDDVLGGGDPYSASKSCCELVAKSFLESYFSHDGSPVQIVTARAGNVVGGGDWSQDRLLPDLVRHFFEEAPFRVRSPGAVRPWQHVLEPLAGYLTLAERAWVGNTGGHSAFNFGPDESSCVPVSSVLEAFSKEMGRSSPPLQVTDPSFKEFTLLSLDSKRAKTDLQWTPRLTLQQTLSLTASWYKAFYAGKDVSEIMRSQITDYFERGTH